MIRIEIPKDTAIESKKMGDQIKQAVLRDKRGVAPAGVYVPFGVRSATGHYTGGTPLADWVPADK